MKKIVSIFISSIVVSTAFVGCKSTDYSMPIEEVYAYTFSQLGDEEMPISTFIAPYDNLYINDTQYPSQATDEMYQMLQDLGVNVIMGVGGFDNNETATQKTLDLCDKYGMAALISGASWNAYDYYLKYGNIVPYAEMTEQEQKEIKETLYAYTEKYDQHTSFAGLHYTDELGISWAQWLKDNMMLFKEKYPDKLYYNNLLGPAASVAQMQYQSMDHGTFVKDAGLTESESAKKIAEDGWQAYIDEYIRIDTPEVFSYDYYLWEKEGLINPYHLKGLGITANTVYEKQIPFWNFIQTGMWAASPSYFRVPDYSELAYEVNTSLAFGAQGIECFLLNPLSGAHDDTYSGATLTGESQLVFDLNGQPTSLYEPLKKVFDGVKAIDHVLMKSVWKGILETKDLEVQINALQTISTSSLEEFNQVKGISSTDAYALAGCFNYQGKTALYVVNASIDKISEVKANITVELKEKCKGYIIQNCQKTNFEESNLVLNSVAPGEGVLVVFE